jgi:NADPH2:quinone reductase
MLAWVGTPDGPKTEEMERPSPAADQVLVRIRAAALNRADLFMASGGTHGPRGGPGAVMGLEWAGQVVETGERVMGTGAGYAEYAAVDRSRIVPIPEGMPYEEAAGLPVALQTMHDAIVTNGALQLGQSVLIHGASSGVGLMGLQVAKMMGAGVVIGSSGDAVRRARLAEFGADLAVDYGADDWVEQVRGATRGQGVDLAVDQISGPGFNRTMKATRVLGRIVNVGRLGGQHGEVDFNLHALKRITYVGVTFRTRSKDEIAEIVRRMARDLWPALEAGKLRLPVDSVHDFEALPAALERMAANRHFGKVVLKGTPSP